MFLWNAAELPKRFLDSISKCFEGFGETEIHRFDVAVGQHTVEQRMIKLLASDFDMQVIADGEVTGRDASGEVDLAEVDLLVRTGGSAPLGDASLKGSPGGVRETDRETRLGATETV